MNRTILTVDAIDVHVSAVLERLETSGLEDIGPSDIIAATLFESGHVADGLRLVAAQALPRGDLVADVAARVRRAPSPVGPFERPRGYAPAGELVLSDLARLAADRRAPGTLADLAERAAYRLRPEERVAWHPMDMGVFRQLLASRSARDPVGSAAGAGGLWDDLTARVRHAGLAGPSPFHGDRAFDAFYEALTRGLHRAAPRHLLVLRERGVGDQAALVEVARRGLAGDPPFLSGRRFGRIDFRRLPAESARAAIEEVLVRAADQHDVILCVDGFVNLLRPHGGLDNSARVATALTRSAGRVIGLLTPREFEEHIAFNPEALELFGVIPLHEPDLRTAQSLTAHYAAGLAMHYGIRIEDAAVRRSVALTATYVLHERLPAKAVNVLRAVCDDLDFDRSQRGSTRDIVTEAEVTAKVAAMSGIPQETLTGVGGQTDYAKALSALVVGQDHAIREVAAELGLITAGLVDPGKPASVLMLIGQTGTGKTELAKALARLYSSSKRLKTFTLGNFSEPHSVSGLIGVPPGYVGHDQGGRLVNELIADPYGVFLLDEADKAHPDVMQPFLNLFDEGWVHDQRGVKAHADRAVFILTTNVGQRQIADLFKQGKSVEEVTWTMKESLSRIRHTKSNRPVFTAEFLARVKRVIVFRPLDVAAMQGIARKLVADMQTKWRTERQRDLRVCGRLVEAVGSQGFAIDQKSQGKEGGRIIRRLLRDAIESPIQTAIADSPESYRDCGTVEVEYYGPVTESTPAAEDGAGVPVVVNLDVKLVRVSMAPKLSGFEAS